jgi:hypothetical protein
MLTDAQLAILAADINGSTDQEVIDARTIRNDTLLAEIYNRDSAYVVWRTSVPEIEIVQEESPDASLFDWAVWMGTGVTEIEAWKRIFAFDGTCNMSKPNIRAAWDEIFAGPAAADMRAHLISMGKRFATRCEALYAVGTGSDADPGTLDFDGMVTIQDIGRALN